MDRDSGILRAFKFLRWNLDSLLMIKQAAPADDVVELRKRPRFGVPSNVVARMNGVPVVLVDIAAGGLQIEHSSAIRLGSIASVAIEGEELLELKARIVWSSFRPGGVEQNLYRSGLSFEAIEQVAGKLGRFIRAYGRPDSGSLEKKRERLLARQERPPAMVYISTTAQSRAEDELMMVQHARQHLASSPDKAMKWYNRARFALAERVDVATELASVPHRQEVLAVWEYMERRVSITTIVKAFDTK